MTNLEIRLHVDKSNITPQYKKELLIRKSIGKKNLQSYIKKIMNLLNLDEDNIKLLSLFESDNIFFNRDYHKKYNIIRERKYLLSEYGDFHTTLMNVLKRKEFFVFLDYDWENCGAFILRESEKLNLEFGLGEDEINNEIHFISTDQKIRVLLDYTNSGDKSFIEYINYESEDKV